MTSKSGHSLSLFLPLIFSLSHSTLDLLDVERCGFEYVDMFQINGLLVARV